MHTIAAFSSEGTNTYVYIYMTCAERCFTFCACLSYVSSNVSSHAYASGISCPKGLWQLSWIGTGVDGDKKGGRKRGKGGWKNRRLERLPEVRGGARIHDSESVTKTAHAHDSYGTVRCWVGGSGVNVGCGRLGRHGTLRAKGSIYKPSSGGTLKFDIYGAMVMCVSACACVGKGGQAGA